MTANMDTFDYIVTGAGSAGCVVAARLSEGGRYRVLLLEAGGDDSNPWIHVPMGYPKVFANPRFNWMYESEPEPGLMGRRLYQPRGKVLGAPARSTAWCTCAATRRTTTSGASAVVPAGTGTVCCPISGRARTRRTARTRSTASAAPCVC